MTHFQRDKIEAFKKWLTAQGAEVLPPTNQWEVVRFKCKDGVGVLYENARGTFKAGSPVVSEAYDAFINRKKWEGRPKKIKRFTHSKIKQSLIKRDGSRCFYCQEELTDSNITEEHLLNLIHGGNTLDRDWETA